jgi:hypothetical protein
VRPAALYSFAVLLRSEFLCSMLFQFSLAADEMQYKAYQMLRHWAALLAVFLCCVWLWKSILVVLLCRQQLNVVKRPSKGRCVSVPLPQLELPVDAATVVIDFSTS